MSEPRTKADQAIHQVMKRYHDPHPKVIRAASTRTSAPSARTSWACSSRSEVRAAERNRDVRSDEERRQDEEYLREYPEDGEQGS